MAKKIRKELVDNVRQEIGEDNIRNLFGCYASNIPASAKQAINDYCEPRIAKMVAEMHPSSIRAVLGR